MVTETVGESIVTLATGPLPCPPPGPLVVEGTPSTGEETSLPHATATATALAIINCIQRVMYSSVKESSSHWPATVIPAGTPRASQRWRRSSDHFGAQRNCVEELDVRANAFGQRRFRCDTPADVLLDFTAQHDELIVGGTTLQQLADGGRCRRG